MNLMIDGGEAGNRNRACAAGVELMLPLIADTARTGIDFVSEVGVRYMKFIRVNSDNGPCDLCWSAAGYVSD